MVLQSLVLQPNKSVQNIEVLFQPWELLIEQCSDTESAHNCNQAVESYFRILENHKQQASNVIHALAVFNLRVEQCIGPQDISKLFRVNSWHLMFRS